MSDANVSKGRKGGKNRRRCAKGRIDITSLVLADRSFPNVNAYEFYIPSFDPLFISIGEGSLMIVFALMGFDVKDTHTCRGFQCPERFYDSRYFYCRSCYLQMKEDGFDWCKRCRRPMSDCDHCPECGLITCMCDRCEWCGCSYTLCIC